MALIKSVRGCTPKIAPSCYIACNATIIGDVHIGPQSSVWFQAVIRGDVNTIRIGKKTNIQDGVIIHCTYQKTQTIIGNRVSIGHGAILHGCQVHDNALIGMRAIILDNAIIQAGALIAAGATVLENTTVEAHCLYAGTPAKKIKKLSKTTQQSFASTPENYVKYSQWYKNK